MPRAIHSELHFTHRIGWLRAAVLGANDGIVSTAALIVGVAAAESSRHATLLAGLAGLVAGAMSMAAGEYVSVSSQSDTEKADMARERRELAEQPDAELAELTGIYEKRGLDHALARLVAEQLTARDAFAAHARDGLGLVEFRPATGRTHQIRVHALEGLGHAVVGDPVYGTAHPAGMMLHAAELIVPRAGKEDVAAVAPWPERFAKIGFGDPDA